MTSLREKAARLQELNAELDRRKKEIETQADRMLERNQDGVEIPSPHMEEPSNVESKTKKKDNVYPFVRLDRNGRREDPEDEIDVDEPILEGLGSRADEIGSTAIIRVQKAQIQCLENRVQHLMQRIKKSETEKEKEKGLRAELKSARDESSRAQKQLAAEMKKTYRLKKQVDALEEDKKKLHVDVKTYRKEILALKEKTKENAAKNSGGDANGVRINRALEELSRCREKLKHSESNKKEETQAFKDKLKAQDAEIRKLERHRAELISAFKKQNQLIEVLKKQKLHLEAARLLQFTEDEFNKAIEKGM